VPTGTVLEQDNVLTSVYEKLSVLPAVSELPFPENVRLDDVVVKKFDGNPDVFVMGNWTADELDITYEKFSYRYTGSVYDPNDRSGIITS
jgi:hypothetical protein